MARRGYYEEYTLDELNQTYPSLIELNSKGKQNLSIEDNSKKDDDKLHSNTWTAAYKFAAYYYDKPQLDERIHFFNLFRFNFGNILQKTKTPNELPDMTSRNSLVEWVCKKHNEFLEVNRETFRMDCNLERLVKTYGPNYDRVKEILGEYQYDF
jgi:hypothetical protein